MTVNKKFVATVVASHIRATRVKL